jgi:transposase
MHSLVSARKGYDYLTVFADLQQKREIFVTEGKDGETFQRFTDELYAHNEHHKAITQIAIEMRRAYQKGVRENLGNAQIIFNKYHAVAMVNEAEDKLRKAEARRRDQCFKKELKATRWIFRKNSENMTQKQTQQLEALDMENLVTRLGYQMRLNFQQVYRRRNEETARKNMLQWVGA